MLFIKFCGYREHYYKDIVVPRKGDIWPSATWHLHACTVNTPTGGKSDVALKVTHDMQVSVHARDPSWLLIPWEITQSPKQGNSGPTKWILVQQKHIFYWNFYYQQGVKFLFFPIFLSILLFFSNFLLIFLFLAILHLTCISCISF